MLGADAHCAVVGLRCRSPISSGGYMHPDDPMVAQMAAQQQAMASGMAGQQQFYDMNGRPIPVAGQQPQFQQQQQPQAAFAQPQQFQQQMPAQFSQGAQGFAPGGPGMANSYSTGQAPMQGQGPNAGLTGQFGLSGANQAGYQQQAPMYGGQPMSQGVQQQQQPQMMVR